MLKKKILFSHFYTSFREVLHKSKNKTIIFFIEVFNFCFSYYWIGFRDKESKNKEIIGYRCDRKQCINYIVMKRESIVKRFRSHQRVNKWYNCRECDNKFVIYGQLLKHKRSVHQINEFKYDFKDCSFVSKCIHNLKSDKLIHNKEKAICCLWPQCGKRFWDNYKLKRHINTHLANQ